MLSQGRLAFVVQRRGSVSEGLALGDAGGGQESVQRRALGRRQVLCFQQLPESAATGGQPGDHFLKHVVQCEFRQGQTQRFQDARQHGTATGSANCFVSVRGFKPATFSRVRIGHCC
jgi:hypothetical protein